MILNVAIIVGIMAVFLPMEYPLEDDTLIAVASSPRWGGGHIELKTDKATATRFVVQIYDSNGEMSTFDVELFNIHFQWNASAHTYVDYQYRPVVVGLKNIFSIVYTGNPPELHLRVAFFSYTGFSRSNTIEFNTWAYRPYVTILANGDMALIWHEGVNYKLYRSLYNQDGVKFLDAVLISDFGNRGSITGYIDGGWAAVYERGDCGCSYVTSQPASGPAFVFNISASWTPEEYQARLGSYYPSINAFYDRLGFVASWNKNGTNYLRTFDEKGNPLSETVILVHPDNAHDVNKLSDPAMALPLGYTGERGFLLTWKESGSFSGALAQEIFPNGTLGQLKALTGNTYFFPFGFVSSAGYGIEFYDFVQTATIPNYLMYATCNQTDDNPCSAGETYHPENICDVFPCKRETCCSKQEFSVKHNNVEIPPVPIRTSSASVESNGLSLVGIPVAYIDMNVFVPISLTKGSRITLECGTEQVTCTFILVVYNCEHCSEGIDGGFPTSLPKLGWVEVGDAPQFLVGESSKGYSMRAFKLSLPTNHYVGRHAEITAESEGPYVAIFGKQGAVTTRPVTPSTDEGDCSFPAVLPEMVKFMNDFSNFSNF